MGKTCVPLSAHGLTHGLLQSLQNRPLSLQPWCISAKSFQSYPTLCNPVACSLPGSSVLGILQQEYWSGLPCLPPGHLPNPGIKLVSLMFPALRSGFFTTSTTWEGILFKKKRLCMETAKKKFFLELGSFSSFLENIILFIWLHGVFVLTRGIFNCSMQTLR